jgi:purine-binding chemotaxis protein CheW
MQREQHANEGSTRPLVTRPLNEEEQAPGGVEDHAVNTLSQVSVREQLGNEQSGGTQLVTFLLEDEEFGFDIMSVQEIIRLPRMSRLPHTAEYVEGVCSLRGTLLPIIDIRARFGMNREDRTERSRVLVLDVDGRRTGVLVDGVRQVTRVGHHEFERPPAAIRNRRTDFVNGVVKLDGGVRIIIALDAGRICKPEQAAEKTDIPAREDASSGSSKKMKEKQSPAEAFTLAPGGPDTAKQSIGGNVQQIVSFQLGREEFGFPMEDVSEILRVQTPKGVPGAPDHVLGVLTVRGKVLPIVDLRRLLELDSFAAENVNASRDAVALYREVLNHGGTDNQAQSDRRSDARGVFVASEKLRTWLSGFNSSSQALMESIAQIRACNEQVAKQSSLEIFVAGGSAHRQQEITAGIQEVIKALEIFQQQVHDHIQEDQRIIVVNTDGFQLGLVVDHVNEVLGVREEAIEAFPDMGGHDDVRLSGIAKLEDGTRLILLMDTSGLLRGKGLADVTDALHNIRQTDERRGEPGAGATEHELQLVTFLLGQEEYGIPIASIQEIDRLSRVTRTPKAPVFVEGVTNLRGEVIPVLSTRALFGLEAQVANDRTRVIIVDLGGTKTGLVVDAVKEVISISSRNIAPPPPGISQGGDGQCIAGIGKVDDCRRMIVLLDVANVLTRGEHSGMVEAGRQV